MFARFFSRHRKICQALPKTKVSRAWGLAGFIALTAAGLSYVIIVNAVATQGYQIRNLQKQLTELKSTSKKLEVDSANLQSLKTIAASLPPAEFVTVESLEYLAANPAEVGVAVK